MTEEYRFALCGGDDVCDRCEVFYWYLGQSLHYGSELTELTL